MTTWSRILTKSAGFVAAVGLTAGLMMTTYGAAFADDVASGQFVSKDGLHCGGQQRITGSVSAAVTDFDQFSWIYYNCSDQSVRRKADIKHTFDGDCRGIGPGQARVLAVQWGSPLLSDHRYNGTKAC